jgi:hypothetical protein
MKGTSGPLRVALTRLLPVAVVAAALAVPAVATAQAPSTGSPAIDRLLGHFRPADFDRKEDEGGGQPVPSNLLPGPADSALAAANPGFAGFNGLSALDQISADDGNQASLEPPDQALCVGGGEVIEAVNDVIATYDRAGATTSGPTGFVPFFFPGQHEETFDADGNPVSFGPFVSDPKCYFDPDLQRFFVTMLEIDDDPVTGAFEDHTTVQVAVSKTSAPSTDRADWFFYAIDTTNDGTNGTPTHPNCPCLGDQPLIGADRFGFYVTTNEFPLDFDNPAFNGAQVYAIDKAAAAAGSFKMQTIDGTPIPLEEGPAASLQPATSPTAADWVATNGGTEYLLSSLDFDGTVDNRIATWALTNTSSLATATPAVKLSHVTIESEPYAFPPDAVQKKGPTPLRDLLNEQTKPGRPFKLLQIAGNDDRMNQVVFAGGHLYGALNTQVDGRRVGLAWFVVTPSLPEGGTISASIARQGYVAVKHASALYPSIAVNAAGHGVMTFSLTGKDVFPSAAYTTIDLGSGTGPVHVGGAGTEPIDGLFGYVALGGVSRWGDYSAAAPDADGSLWIATEYVPGGPRDPAENWGTFVGRLVP